MKFLVLSQLPLKKVGDALFVIVFHLLTKFNVCSNNVLLFLLNLVGQSFSNGASFVSLLVSYYNFWHLPSAAGFHFIIAVQWLLEFF